MNVARKTDRKHGGPASESLVSHLSDEQETELWTMILSLKNKGLTPEQLHAKIKEKLSCFNADEKKSIAQDDPTAHLKSGPRLALGPCGGPNDFVPPKESDTI